MVLYSLKHRKQTSFRAITGDKNHYGGIAMGKRVDSCKYSGNKRGFIDKERAGSVERT